MLGDLEFMRADSLIDRARTGLFLILLLFILLPPLRGVSAPLIQEEQDTPAVHFDYRMLQPGEAVKVSLSEGGDIENAYLRFLDKKIDLGRSVHSPEILAIIGLDLNMKPGIYPVEVYITYRDGHEDLVKKPLSVSAREFPVRRLWVEERYVTPPAAVNERIQRESALLRSIYQLYSPQWFGDGEFILPVTGKQAFNFGQRRIFNDQPRSPHSGEDISAPAGTPVKASNFGRIVLAADLYFSGNTVVIDHGVGVFTYYCHFSKILVEQGNDAEKGEIIGEVGATGRVTGPHLHWSVRINGSRIDPYSMLALNFSP